MDENRAEMLAAMYQRDDEADAKMSETSLQMVEFGFKKTRRIVIGEASVDFPTPEYVERVERMTMDAMLIISEQGLAIKRLEANLMNLRRHNSQQARKLLDMNHEIGKKIDSRD